MSKKVKTLTLGYLYSRSEREKIKKFNTQDKNTSTSVVKQITGIRSKLLRGRMRHECSGKDNLEEVTFVIKE